MYQSKAIEELLKTNLEPEEIRLRKKEEKIQNLLDGLRTKPWTMQSLICINLIGLLLCFIFALPVFTSTRPGELYIKILMCSIPLILSMPMTIEAFFSGRKVYTNILKLLFIELANNPYEFRCSYEKDNKIKIIIEENLYHDTSHVIKEKSKHITAYLDYTKSHESIVEFIQELVKKSESTFKV